MKTGIELITKERNRQIKQEGWSFKHDDTHKNSELAMAAICYASPVPLWREASTEEMRTGIGRIGNDEMTWHLRNPWPWEEKWWKPSDNSIRNLVKAGALIAAEIDRLQRLRKLKK